LHKSWEVLAPSGRLVTIAADSEETSDARTKAAFFIVEPRRDQLAEIGALLEAGDLRAVVNAEVPLAEAGAAYSGQGLRSGRGKVVVVVQP
jgi:NADPH:quinone reductase-like Zn-dependent oxidoreductase